MTKPKPIKAIPFTGPRISGTYYPAGHEDNQTARQPEVYINGLYGSVGIIGVPSIKAVAKFLNKVLEEEK